MYTPTTRLLTILELLQSRGLVTAQELAQTLEVEQRSVRRYVMMLRDMGIPIESERGRYGGYALRPGYRLPPLMFNRDEIVAVMTGLTIMREMGAISAAAVDSAASKIERVLPDDLRQRSHALRQALTVELPATYPVSSQWLLAINLAVLNKQPLAITYALARGEVTRRVISPYGVVVHGQAWYVPAYCHLREGYRVFRLDRVRAVAESPLAYREAEINAKAFVLQALAQMPGLHAFEVVLHAPLATVTEYVPASMALLEAEGTSTVMRCYSDDAYWLARYLLRLELPFTVRQTEALRDALRDIAENVLASVATTRPETDDSASSG